METQGGEGISALWMTVRRDQHQSLYQTSPAASLKQPFGAICPLPRHLVNPCQFKLHAMDPPGTQSESIARSVYYKRAQPGTPSRVAEP